MKKKVTKKKNPQDATIRNVRAWKKAIEKLDQNIAAAFALIIHRVELHACRLDELENPKVKRERK